MATASLTSTEYHLDEATRQEILASMPARIQYVGGIVPDYLVQTYSELFPSLKGLTNLSQAEMERLMNEEVALEWRKFVEVNGEAF